MTDAHPYATLSPDTVLDAVEQAGHRPDGHLLALNSYENRVYQVGIEDAAPLVAKFYRPQRWTAEEILEEHGDLAVTWGDVHRLRYGGRDLPANGAEGDPIGVFRTSWMGPGEENGTFPVMGGDGFYAAVEFSQPVRARVLLAYGNATQPGSPHIGDQIEQYARKEMRAPWLTRAEVEAHLESRERLQE